MCPQERLWGIKTGALWLPHLPLLFLLSSTAPGGWECAPSKLCCRNGQGLTAWGFLSSAFSSSPDSAPCEPQPRPQPLNTFVETGPGWSFSMAAASGSGDTWDRQQGDWKERKGKLGSEWTWVLCKGLGTVVGISQDEAYAELVHTNSVKTRQS